MRSRTEQRRIREFYRALPVPDGPNDLDRRRRDLQVLDTLGPRTRAVIKGSYRDIDCGRMILRWRQKVGMEMRLDLLEAPLTAPLVDEALAAFIAGHVQSDIRAARQQRSG